MAGAKQEELQKWRDYTVSLGFITPAQAEKDYLQEMLLLNLFSVKPVRMLVFRGGTALSKLYATGRFSEDLDFVLMEPTEKGVVKEQVGKAINRMNDYYQTGFTLEEYRNILKYELKLDGPVYNAVHNNQAKQTIRIDINTYAFPLMKPALMRRVPIYDDIRPYYLYSEQPEELVADKIGAILERKRAVARDAYDLWIMLVKYKVKIDMGLVNRKLSLYGKRGDEHFIKSIFIKRLASIGRVWEKEISQLTSTYIGYKDVRKAIYDSIERA